MLTDDRWRGRKAGEIPPALRACERGGLIVAVQQIIDFRSFL
jgi:hypothetical protein